MIKSNEGRICSKLLVAICCIGIVFPISLTAQDNSIVIDPSWAQDPPEISTLVTFAHEQSDLRVALTRYAEDKAALGRRYRVHYSPQREQRFNKFYQEWKQELPKVNFEALNHEGKIDYILLRNRIDYDQKMHNLEIERGKEITELVPFAGKLSQLEERRLERKPVEPREAATTLNDVADTVIRLTEDLKEEAKAAEGTISRPGITRAMANRAAKHVAELQEVISDWDTFYDGYNPMFTFWNQKPYQKLDKALSQYGDAIKKHLVGITEDNPHPIVGDPVHKEGLQASLKLQMIPYNAEELIAIGEQEFKKIEKEFKKISNKMGYGDDWKAALEYVKEQAPPPGEIPQVLADMYSYSMDYIKKMDEITIPPLSEEIWRTVMQTPERQLESPFFTGGEVTHYSYPHESMPHDAKLMSMRGNTPAFNFGTVQHELIPGHHMQGFMSRRFNSQRGNLNRTPFWSEGGAFYWEYVLYDAGYHRDNAERIGTLFWRLHRAARIIFSLNYQLGNWSPQKAVDFLVEKVGHERANAEAEVRRSARVRPLYQISYMIGALQLKALRKELVDTGEMSAKEFHDAIYQGGQMPIELVRVRLTNQELNPDYKAQWQFKGDPLSK